LPDVAQLFHAQGVAPRGGGAGEFAAFLDQQTAKWAKVVKDSGAKTE
jgi:tripartite-type tricarboxylate transporter receptor subunit TctC